MRAVASAAVTFVLLAHACSPGVGNPLGALAPAERAANGVSITVPQSTAATTTAAAGSTPVVACPCMKTARTQMWSLSDRDTGKQTVVYQGEGTNATCLAVDSNHSLVAAPCSPRTAPAAFRFTFGGRTLPDVRWEGGLDLCIKSKGLHGLGVGMCDGGEDEFWLYDVDSEDPNHIANPSTAGCLTAGRCPA